MRGKWKRGVPDGKETVVGGTVGSGKGIKSWSEDKRIPGRQGRDTYGESSPFPLIFCCCFFFSNHLPVKHWWEGLGGSGSERGVVRASASLRFCFHLFVSFLHLLSGRCPGKLFWACRNLRCRIVAIPTVRGDEQVWFGNGARRMFLFGQDVSDGAYVSLF